AASIKVLDTERLEVITPAGSLGKVDVTVRYRDGREQRLQKAFEYRMQGAYQLEGKGAIYDQYLDPSASYLFAAAGKRGVLLYNLQQAQQGEPALVTELALPDNLAALGIDGYFERGYDRIFVSAARFDADGQPEAGSAQLLVYAIDSDDITRLTLVKTLPLGARFAKGLLAENY